MRSGVTARLARRIRSVQSPSQFVMKLIGLAPRSPPIARWTSNARGRRQAAHAPTLRAILPRRVMRQAFRSSDPRGWLVELLQIHPRVQRCHLVGVPVEHQRLAAPELADAPFGGLA